MPSSENNIPDWIRTLTPEDLQFVRRFILASGSLKEMAREYGISYPTVRIRLDRLIARVRDADATGEVDPFRVMMQNLVADGQMTTGTARQIIREHQNALKKGTKA